MGAATFFTTARGRSPEEAFRRAVDQARYMSGHGGYSGTIAEKSEFALLSPRRDGYAEIEPMAYAQRLIALGDPRVDDKYGPAGCVVVKEPEAGSDGEFLFFGWASE